MWPCGPFLVRSFDAMLVGLGCDIDIVVRRKGTGKVRVVGK
jgi:hypothetical protein